MILLSFSLVDQQIQASSVDHDKSAVVRDLKIKDLEEPNSESVLSHDRLLISLEIDNELKQLNLNDFIEIDFNDPNKSETFLEPFEDRGKIFVNSQECGNYGLNKKGCKLVFDQIRPSFLKAKFSFIVLTHNNSDKQQALTIKAGNERKTILIDHQSRDNVAIHKSGIIQGQKVQWQNFIDLTELQDNDKNDVEEKVDERQIIIPDTIQFSVGNKNYTLSEFNKNFTNKVVVNNDLNSISLKLNMSQLAHRSIKMTYQTRIKELNSAPDLVSETKTLNAKGSKSYQFKAISPFSILTTEKEKLGQLLIINKLAKADENADLLANAKFQVKKLNPDTLQFELVKEVSTDQNGLARLNNLGNGVYQIRQIEVPAGILLNNKPYLTEISKEHNQVIVNFVNQSEELSLDKDKLILLPKSKKQLELANNDGKESKTKNLSALSTSKDHQLDLSKAVDSFKKAAPKGKASEKKELLDRKKADKKNNYSETDSGQDKKHLPQAGENPKICWTLLGCLALIIGLLINFILRKEK